MLGIVMKRFTTILLLINVSVVIAQNSERYFEFNDTIFHIGQIKDFEIEYQISGGGYPLKEFIPILDSIADFINKNKNIKIEIGTHSDFRGASDANISLTEMRAEKVKNYLIYKGIDPERLKSVGYGESEPIVVDNLLNQRFSFLPIGTILNKEFCESQTDDDRKEIICKINRRTTLKILSVND
jgi:hypothetical protein